MHWLFAKKWKDANQFFFRGFQYYFLFYKNIVWVLFDTEIEKTFGVTVIFKNSLKLVNFKLVVFHESWTGNKHKIIVLKPANKCQIIWKFYNLKNILINIKHSYHEHSYPASSISLGNKILVKITPYGPFNSKLRRKNYFLFHILLLQKSIL